MLIRKTSAHTGICFAWKPKDTPDGKVWLEYVRWTWIDHGFGGYSYERLPPREVPWDAGMEQH